MFCVNIIINEQFVVTGRHICCPIGVCFDVLRLACL